MYINPPPDAVLLSIDEKTGIQAKSRKYPTRAVAPGRAARREFEYRRHGTVSLMAAMNVVDGTVLANIIERNDSVTFIKFLIEIDQAVIAVKDSLERGDPRAYYGAIDGAYTYSFTPTSLACVVKVRNCVTGDEIDLTDYGAW